VNEVVLVGRMVWVVADEPVVYDAPAPLCSASRQRLTGEGLAEVRSGECWASFARDVEHCAAGGFSVSDLM